MKKQFGKSAAWLIAAMLVLSAVGAGSAQEAGTTPQDMLSAYRDVALGTQPYIQVEPFDETLTEVTMAQTITEWYGYTFDTPMQWSAMAVTDLDKDGNPEVLLKLGEDFGFELLRWHEGTVYGYPFVARAMEAVTADGEIHASNGASNFGWYTIQFNGNAIEPANVCWTSDEETETNLYMIGDAEATEGEFLALNDVLWNKPMIEWTDYTWKP